MFAHFSQINFLPLTVLLTMILGTPAASAGMIDQCRFKGNETAKVARVIDGDTMVLNDGRKVRLIGAAAPKKPLGQSRGKKWRWAGAAKTELKRLLQGKKIMLRYGGRSKDRYGRLLAHIFLQDGTNLWVQSHMISHGLARAYSFSDNRHCIKKLLQIETSARAQKRGLWREPYYRIRQALKVTSFGDALHEFHLVEGRVFKAVKIGRRIYLNFAKDWGHDFTIVINSSSLKLFKRAKFDPLTLTNKKIRVRGWITLMNGPEIKVSHSGQIEILHGRTNNVSAK